MLYNSVEGVSKFNVYTEYTALKYVTIIAHDLTTELISYSGRAGSLIFHYISTEIDPRTYACQIVNIFHFLLMP